MSERVAKSFAAIAFLDNGDCHQVTLSKDQTELLKAFINSLFANAVPISALQLPLARDQKS